MRYRLIIGSVVTILAISACSKQESQTPTLDCDQPQFTDQIQHQLQQNIMANAQQFVQHDERHFVDADKIIAAASQLTVTLTPINDEQTNQSQCHSQLKVDIPSNILQQAQSNAPLLFGQTSLAEQLNQQIQQTNIKFNDHSFIQDIIYTPAHNQADTAVKNVPIDFNLVSMSQLLETTLLPYGVKDILIINGKAYNRADAQAQLLNPASLSNEAQMASAILNGGTTQKNNNTTNNPDTNDQDLDSHLQQARDNYRNANNAMELLWHSLDKTIQSTLNNEQQQWQAQRKQQCQTSAGNAFSAKQTELTHLQCETHLINQRLHYLRGFSIS